jgi:RNA polymerase sigma factor (sigma-70 family)
VTNSELEEWILATSPRAVAYARSLLKNPSDAEDVVQDCFCRLIEKRNRYNLLEDGQKLLFRAITNAAINLTTRRRTWWSLQRDDLTLDPADDKTDLTGASLEAEELQAAIAVALQQLPTQQRAAIELKSLGHSQAEVGEILGTTTSNAGVLIYRARQTLSQALAPWLNPTEEPNHD